MLRKSRKKNYLKFSSYKLIALLNTLSKMLKSIVFERIRYVVETLKTFLNIQMSARRQRLMNTILQLITEKIHTIWNEQKKRMTSFFSLNVNNAFDNVSHLRLLHNMRKKKISDKLLKWMKNFLKNRSTTLTIEDHTIAERKTSVNISQNSSFSPMLYLFYNANLLKSCEDVRLRLNVIEFVNDINILTYNESTERNCEVLKKTWEKVVEWTKRHDFKFNERKHELIHFSKIFKKYNMNVNMTLKKHRVSASTDLRILKVQLNFKLRWKSHFRQMKTKLMSRHNAINMIESLIWNTSLAINKQKYIIIEKSMLAHETAVWYTSFEVKDNRKKIIFKLKVIQERTLRRFIEVYKTTVTKTLKIETYVFSINIHLKKLLQSSIVNINARRSISAIETAMQRIRKNLMSKKKRKLKLRMTSLQAKKR